MGWLKKIRKTYKDHVSTPKTVEFVIVTRAIFTRNESLSVIQSDATKLMCVLCNCDIKFSLLDLGFDSWEVARMG